MFNKQSPQDEAKKLVEIPQKNEVKLLTFGSVKEQSLTSKNEQQINKSSVDSKVQKGEGGTPQKNTPQIACLSNLYPNKEQTGLDYITDETVILNVCDNIYPIGIVESIDKSSNLVVKLVVQNQNKRRFISLPFDCLSSKTDCSKELAKNAFLIATENLQSNVLNYLSSKVRYLQHIGKVYYTYNMLGWSISPITKNKIFLLGKVIGEDLKAHCSRHLKFTNGSEETYNKFLQDVVMESDELQMAFALGLTSIITALLQEYTGIRTVILDIVGESSKGKTTVSYFMASLFGSPKISNDGIMKTFNSTVNALISTNQNNQGVINIIDDASGKAGHIDFESFIYQISTGQAKNRLNSNGTQQKSSNQSWSTMVVVSSEEVIIDESETKLGAIVRLLVAENVEWTKSAEHATKIRDVVSNNYGFIAPKYVEKLLNFLNENGIDKIKEMYESEVERIYDSMANKDNLTRRVCEQLALVGITADFIKTFLGFDISKDKVLSTFIKREQQSIETRNPSENAQDIVLENFAKNRMHFKELAYCSPVAYSEIYGIFEETKDKLILHILPSVLKRWFREANIHNSSKILKQWRNDKIIYKNEDNRLSDKDANLKCRVFKLSFDHSKWEEIKKIIEEETQAVNNQPTTQPSIVAYAFEGVEADKMMRELDEVFGGDENE